MNCTGRGDCRQGRARCRTPLTCGGMRGHDGWQFAPIERPEPDVGLRKGAITVLILLCAALAFTAVFFR